MFSNAIKVLAFSCVVFSSAALADDDDWDADNRYVDGYGYAPVVEEEFFVTPRGVVEEDIIYMPERVEEVQTVQPRYYRPPASNYGYIEQAPAYALRDCDEWW